MADDGAAGASEQSCRGASLEGADFTGRDLRGADFTGADLRSATFRDTRLGVSPRVGAGLFALGIVASVSAGVAIGWAVDQIRGGLTAEQWDEVGQGGILALVLILLVAVVFWQGFDVAIRVVAVAYPTLLALAIVANLLWDEVEWLLALRATAIVVFLVLAVGAGMLGRVIGGVFGAWSMAIVAVLGGLASGQAHGGGAGIIVAVSLATLSKRALRGDPRDLTLRRVAHALVRRWGTRFVDTDLTGADFTGSDVRACDVRGAILVDVTWDPGHARPVDAPPGDG